jgi:hypothetical protein
LAYSKGGKVCGDKAQVNKIRSIGKEMIKIVGKKIISGDLNLTRISFPIKAMVPRTALVNSTISCCMNPYFMKRAAEATDPLERMKYVITNTISAFYYISMFVKPVNSSTCSSTQSSEKPCRPPSPMARKYIVNRFRTTRPSATFWLLDPREATDTTDAITFRPTQGSTPWSWSTRAIKSMNLPVAIESTALSIRKSIRESSWGVSDRRPQNLSFSTIKKTS